MHKKTDSGLDDIINSQEEDSPFIIKMAEHNLNFNQKESAHPEIKNIAFCFTSQKWGQGECGSTLMENFLITLSQSMVKPKYIILMDSAIFLATENSLINSVSYLKELEKAGVKIIINETSAQHYHQMSGILAGEVVKFMTLSQIMFSVEQFINF